MTTQVIKNKEKSKQTEERTGFNQVIEPKIRFSSLLDVYKKSFVAWWITDKIATSINTGFDSSDTRNLELVRKIDYSFLVKNLVVTGNAFFEVIRNIKWEVCDLLPILTETIRKKSWYWYEQNIAGKKVFFNEFCINWVKHSEYRNNANEVYHFKIESLREKNYWSSLFEGVIDQLVLINYIDNYYSSYFENQAIRPNVFTDPEGKLSKKDKESIAEFFKSKMKWIDKAFSTAIIPTNLQKLDLWDEINTESFIKYRQELIKSVCIKLNIPVDLLLSDNSNRASSQVAKEIFNQHTVKPLQRKLIEDLKVIFSDQSIKFNELDTKDQREEAEIYKIYIEAGIMTTKEVRSKLWIQ